MSAPIPWPWPWQRLFLSTPSARRATPTAPVQPCTPMYFYPRPLRGGRLVFRLAEVEDRIISIHALCEEGDPRRPPGCGIQHDFYPRPLRGGRRTTVTHIVAAKEISIHALCEEGDGAAKTVGTR